MYINGVGSGDEGILTVAEYFLEIVKGRHPNGRGVPVRKGVE